MRPCSLPVTAGPDFLHRSLHFRHFLHRPLRFRRFLGGSWYVGPVAPRRRCPEPPGRSSSAGRRVALGLLPGRGAVPARPPRGRRGASLLPVARARAAPGRGERRERRRSPSARPPVFPAGSGDRAVARRRGRHRAAGGAVAASPGARAVPGFSSAGAAAGAPFAPPSRACPGVSPASRSPGAGGDPGRRYGWSPSLGGRGPRELGPRGPRDRRHDRGGARAAGAPRLDRGGGELDPRPAGRLSRQDRGAGGAPGGRAHRGTPRRSFPVGSRGAGWGGRVLVPW